MARRNDDGTTGDRVGRDPEDLSQGVGQGEEASIPDIGDLLADDAFLDALARGIEQDTASEDALSGDTAALAGLLGDWRNDIMSAPLPPAPSLDEVEAAMQRAAGPAAVASAKPGQGGPGRRSTRWLSSVAGVAAAAAVVLGGLAVVSQNAQPGDPLWGFRQQIHGSSETTVMVAGLWNELEQAERALESGDMAQVQRILSEVAPRIGQLQGSDQDTLTSKFQQLSENLQQNPRDLDRILDMPRPAAPAATSDEETSDPPRGQLPTGVVIPGLPTDFPTNFPTQLPTGLPVPDFTVDPEVLLNNPWNPGPEASATPGASQPPATTTGQDGTSTAPTTTGTPSTTTGKATPGKTTAGATTGASSAPSSTTTSVRPTSPRASATTAGAPVPDDIQVELDDVATSTSEAAPDGPADGPGGQVTVPGVPGS